MKVKPWPELQEELPSLSSWEQERLKESIENVGILEPILCLPDGRIIDGHHRLKYSDGNPPHKVVDVDEETAFSIGLRINAERRNLTLEQQKKLWKKIRKRASVLRSEGLTQKEVANKLGIAQNTVSVWEDDVNNITNDSAYIPDCRVSIPKSERSTIYERADTGETHNQLAADYKVSRARISQIVKQEKHKAEQETPPLPAGEFDVILADPPWQMGSISDSRDILNQYPTMSTEDICSLNIPTADDSVLFLWTFPAMLKDSLKVIDEWGYDYKSGLVWIKDSIGMGFYARMRHEFVFIGTRGDFGPPEQESRQDSVIEAPRRGHSEKPVEIYNFIENSYPDGKYLELFARNKREGWTVWGDEVGD